MKHPAAFLTALTLAILAPALDTRAEKKETPEQHQARMGWWHEAKFGLFIHWGVYSVPAGYYRDKPVPGYGEWIMSGAKIPMAEYQAFAREFNPVKYNADDWVRAAKEAGMKYIVLTTKHHDGFAMFETQASPWNIVQATPYHKDPLKDLSAACRKYGIKLGFYYSQAQDWNNGGACKSKWDPAQEHDMDDYIEKIAVPQVTELLSHYGEFPSIFWWDTPHNMNSARAQKIYDVVQKLRPDMVMNDRLGGGFGGDTHTPEQKIYVKVQKYNWETCTTLQINSWGYKKNCENWKSAKILIRSLCDVASKGGNYLLNVGPTSEGLIPQGSLDRLAEIGKWMQVNSEAIYGSHATCFGAELGEAPKAKDGSIPSTVYDTVAVTLGSGWRCTTKPGKVYLHIFNWPANGKFDLPGLQSKVVKAYLLAGRKDIGFTQTDSGVSLNLPETAPDKIASVVCLEIADPVAKVAAPVPAPKN